MDIGQVNTGKKEGHTKYKISKLRKNGRTHGRIYKTFTMIDLREIVEIGRLRTHCKS